MMDKLEKQIVNQDYGTQTVSSIIDKMLEKNNKDVHFIWDNFPTKAEMMMNMKYQI